MPNEDNLLHTEYVANSCSDVSRVLSKQLVSPSNKKVFGLSMSGNFGNVHDQCVGTNKVPVYLFS